MSILTFETNISGLLTPFHFLLTSIANCFSSVDCSVPTLPDNLQCCVHKITVSAKHLVQLLFETKTQVNHWSPHLEGLVLSFPMFKSQEKERHFYLPHWILTQELWRLIFIANLISPRITHRQMLLDISVWEKDPPWMCPAPSMDWQTQLSTSTGYVGFSVRSRKEEELVDALNWCQH